MPQLANGLGLSRARFSGAAWTPALLSPIIWCDATQLGLSNGDPVSAFTNLGSGADDFTASGTARPTFIASGINGQPALEGDGVDDTMTIPAVGELEDWWAFIAFAPVTMASGKELWAVNDYPASDLYRLLETNSGTTININQLGGPMPTSITLANGVQRVIRLEGHITSIHYQADNGTKISVTGLTGNYPTSGNDGRLANFGQRLFARGDPGLFFNVRIGEIILGGGTLSAADETAVWTYLNSKWGTSIPA
jgi:hypothetical protein